MAIKRQKLDRKINIAPDQIDLIEMTPNWKFTIISKDSGPMKFDLSYLQNSNRQELASQMRNALWNLRHESELASLKSYDFSIRKFWKFLDDLEYTGHNITRLKEIDRECIDKYVAWLERQIITSHHKNIGLKISPALMRNSFAGIKSILINRQRCVPAEVNTALTFPHNPFPNSSRLSAGREPYSPTEHKRILSALNKDLDSINNNYNTLPSMQILVTYLLLFAAATGANLQPLLELKRDSIGDHPLADRELLITSKRRGRTTFATSIRKIQSEQDVPRKMHAIPATIGEHFRNLCRLTLPLAKNIPHFSDFVFLWSVSRGTRKNQTIRLTQSEAKTGIRDFAKRHRILNDAGDLLTLSISRFRPTYATELYRRSKDIRMVSQALGHASVETTARSYARLPLEADRNHALVAESMVSQFTQTMVDGKILLAADGRIPIKNMDSLLINGYTTGIARCANPFREDESVCKKFFTCFKCPNMMVFEDDLWRLFSFYYRILAERPKLVPSQWMKTYGPIIRRIDDDITPLFPLEKVELAKKRAKTDSHPTWKDPLL